MAEDKYEFVLPNDTQVVLLDCKEAFKSLTENEKLYAHYLSRAAWYGGLIVLLQTSPEASIIFIIFHKVFKAESTEELYKKAMKNFSEEEFKAFLVYVCGIFSNMGNYKSFGDTKFIPNLNIEKLEGLLFSSKAFERERSHLTSLWEKCKYRIYSLEQTHRALGFPDKGTTTYFSSKYTSEDSKHVNDFMKLHKIGGYNTRTFKEQKEDRLQYEIRLASSEEGFDPAFMMPPTDFGNSTFLMTRNDYGELLMLVVKQLEKALAYAANWEEESMLHKYIESFKSGSLDAHKEGSRHWIRDKSPIIETYIGFIETYRDPDGIRGEFEGFVAMVNKPMSAKFKTLVNMAKDLTNRLPWDPVFEKDEFLQPDFTSLDVLTFSGSGIPAGINIPNYDEIRQEEGFKNVSLGNVIPATYKSNDFFFLDPSDQELMMKFSVQAFEVQVGLHELLGHGSGKLFRKSKDGSLNFKVEDVPLIKESQEALWYEEGETFDSVFTDISSTYEECRAECVGLYLSLDKDILKVFGHEGKEAEDITYTNWLNLLWAGAGKALEMYQPATKSWLQAHSQARFIITRVLMEAGEGLFTVKETKVNHELLCTLDRSKIYTIGKEALGKFLQKLQIFKSTRNDKEARQLFKKYSDVNNDEPYPWARWRNIIIQHKKPRKMFVQSNTVITSDGVILKEYPQTHEGLIKSWVERFDNSELYIILESLWHKDIHHFEE